MISVALIADSGPALEAMTSSLASVPGVNIVRHCHGHARIGSGLTRCAPDLILLDEIRAALPHAHVVVRAARPESGWLAEALQAGASAVVPATAGAETLGVVLNEVVAERRDGHTQDRLAA